MQKTVTTEQGYFVALMTACIQLVLLQKYIFIYHIKLFLIFLGEMLVGFSLIIKFYSRNISISILLVCERKEKKRKFKLNVALFD